MMSRKPMRRRRIEHSAARFIDQLVEQIESEEGQDAAPRKLLAKSPRGGVTYCGRKNDGTPFACRIRKLRRTPVTLAQSNEIAIVYRRIAEAYNGGELEKMCASMRDLPEAVTNMDDRHFDTGSSNIVRRKLEE